MAQEKRIGGDGDIFVPVNNDRLNRNNVIYYDRLRTDSGLRPRPSPLLCE